MVAYQGQDGDFVAVLTSPEHAPQLLPVRFVDLLEVLPEESVVRINPNSEVSITTSRADLRVALADVLAAPEALAG